MLICSQGEKAKSQLLKRNEPKHNENIKIYSNTSHNKEIILVVGILVQVHEIHENNLILSSLCVFLDQIENVRLINIIATSVNTAV